MFRICHPLQTLETKEVLVNSKTNPALSSFGLYLPFSILILILFIGGCRQNEENASTSSTPAYIVPINDNNNDGFPDGWQVAGTQAHVGDYEITLDTSIGHADETSLLIQTDKDIQDGGFGTALRTLDNTNQYKGNRLQLSGYIKTEDVSDWAALWFRVDGVGRGNALAFDNMADRAPKGTTDWQRF